MDIDTQLVLHTCPDCEREFKTASALISHSKVHKPKEVAAQAPIADYIGVAEHLFRQGEPEVQFPDPQLDQGSTAPVRVLKLPHYRDLPMIARATDGSAGYDLYAAIDRHICIGVGERAPVPTGLCLEIPSHMYALIAPRSGLACKKGVTVVNAPGVIDSDYRGEIICHLVNHSNTKFWVEPGMRVAQMIFHRYEVPELVPVDELNDTSRGTGGFGSTGT